MKVGRWLLLLGALLAVVFVGLKESREPHLWLFVDDVLHPKLPPESLAVSDDVGLRAYADTRPHNGKTARLQKGLVLLVKGRERIEEGFGFGLPLIEADGQAYLSRSASLQRRGDALVKRYVMDTLDTPSGFLRRKYEPVPPIGTVVVTYTVSGNAIDVGADFSGLEIEWDRAYLMSEQGARFFTRYEEPGLAVEGERFGRWEPTVGKRGCIVAADRSVRFCVETEQESHRYYGRERYVQYYWIGIYWLSWAGVDIEVPTPMTRYAYSIVIEEAGAD